MSARSVDQAAPASVPPASTRRLLVCLLPASTAMYAGFQAMSQILIPTQVAAIDPINKVEKLGALTSLSAITAVLGLLFGGALSDRTIGRWGRRAPSLAAGAFFSAMLMLFVGSALSYSALLWSCCALWFTANYYQSALTAVLPDRTPPSQRGVAASVLAFGIPLGGLLGVNFAAHVERGPAYAGAAGLLIVTTLALLVLAPEPPAYRRIRLSADHADLRSRGRAGAGVREFLSSFTHGDFALAFVSRAMMFLSFFMMSGYTVYVLQDLIGSERLPGRDPQLAASILYTIQTAGWMISVAAAGAIADRWGRPKLMAAISSLGVAGALLTPAISPSWEGMVVLQVLMGVFFGSYLAVDLALVSMVLPNRDTEGRDLAILAVAVSSTQIVSPMIASRLIATFGYTSLFVFAAGMALASGVLLSRIRKVR